MRAADTERARSALSYVSSSVDRDEWVALGMSIHAAGLSEDDFHAWSESAVNYNKRDCHDVWKSFSQKSGGITEGKLFAIAIENGWKEGRTNQKTMDSSELLREAAAKSASAPPRKPVAPGQSASEVYARCRLATYSHPYIEAKQAAGVPLDSLRVVPEGEPMAGALVVPCVAPDGELLSLQFITTGATAERLKAAGRKTKPNLYGHQLGDGYHVIGELAEGAPAMLCEGIGAAWSAWQATGQAAVCTFGSGRYATVAKSLRQSDDNKPLILVADVGKEESCNKLAIQLGNCKVVQLPEGWPNNSDINDFAIKEGTDALEALLSGAKEPLKPEPKLKAVGVLDLFSNPSPPPAFVWDGYLPRDTVSLLGAHGGTGKSTIALMLAVCVALGRPLFEVETVHGRVLFVSLEDPATIVRHRLQWILRAWHISPDALAGRLVVVDGADEPELASASGPRGGLDITETGRELVAMAAGFDLVVVDNASDAFGGDEIQRRQVRSFMRMLRVPGAAVLLLAHVDKGTSRARKAEGGEGYSGSTAWHNSARSRLFLSRDDSGLLTFEHQKTNFGKKLQPLLTLEWPEDGLPHVLQAGPGFDFSQQQGRADDQRALALLRLIAEFEGRGQYCHTGATSRSNPFNVLKSEPDFQKLKLNSDATKRIVNQCQRAGWIEPLDYRTPDRKPHQRWAMTVSGYDFAGLSAPTAPTAPTTEDGTGPQMAQASAPTAPTGVGGVGGRARTEVGAEDGKKP